MIIVFFLVWIIFNGRITTEIVLMGVAIAALMYGFVCKFMDFSWEREKSFYKKAVFLVSYIAILVKEIVKANLTVMHMIVTQKELMEPVIVKFRTHLQTEWCRVLLANSITLTPGTITVSLEGDEYVVHCLDKTLAEGMEDSIFVKMLEEMERKG